MASPAVNVQCGDRVVPPSTIFDLSGIGFLQFRAFWGPKIHRSTKLHRWAINDSTHFPAHFHGQNSHPADTLLDHTTVYFLPLLSIISPVSFALPFYSPLLPSPFPVLSLPFPSRIGPQMQLGSTTTVQAPCTGPRPSRPRPYFCDILSTGN